MPTPAVFPHADVLASLAAGDLSGLPAEHVDTLQKREALLALLKAGDAVHRAAIRTTQVADALRRDQKFVRPGQPSAQLIGLRQQQAAARQATHQSKQAFILAADGLVRVLGLMVPQRMGLEAFVQDWLRTQVSGGTAS